MDAFPATHIAINVLKTMFVIAASLDINSQTLPAFALVLLIVCIALLIEHVWIVSLDTSFFFI